MAKTVMVRCYLFCLLTLALCSTCGLVWADNPKTSESSNCVNYVGFPPFFVKIDSCDEARNATKAAEPTIQRSPGKPGPDTPGDHSGREVNQVTTNSHQEEQVPESDHEENTVNSETDIRRGSQNVEQTLKGDGTASSNPGQNNPLSSPESAEGRDIQVTEEHPLPASPVSDRQQSGEAPSVSTQANRENPTVSESAPNGGEHRSPHENTPPLQEQEVGSATTRGSQVAPNTDESYGTGNKQSTTTSDTNTTPNSEGSTSTTTTTTTTLPPELTNNKKKGDADSSSSISSSVWVRVPLLIVVTLACILVC
ncbi:uncharacterized protein TM35_000901100 [Trypanosoma theileri]|uniref:Mucin-associated surface protein (MASP) n=1 Tax=Trypanosoma theileri TaxID=67003 RepID=A0A1X0NFC4_9TRYP|nr:uncharacterized protein TM35_000901100 [Trypanosoma theileri]ORC82512.1 hypothetical protein TM35_000901100 [Trypanosoma theileri]